MQENKKVNNYRVPKGTTHLMMWIGSGLPTEREVHYQNENGEPLKYEITNKRNGEMAVVNYVATLRGECEKMNKKGDSCILVYDSRMIRQKDKEEMEKIVKGIPNCYLVDYKEYVEELKKEKDLEFKGSTEVDDGRVISLNCKQSEFIKDMDDNITYNSETNGISMLKKYSIGNLVDCMRILLLLHPGKLKKLANEKNDKKIKKLDCKDYTLLYHDFDMIQPDQEVYKNNQQDNDDEIKKEQALFGKNMGNGCGAGNENGLIWVNSNGDRNEVLENMISNYLYGPICNENGRKIYSHAYLANANNFNGQFSDESHQSWEYASETDIKKHINICENDYSTIKERKLVGLLWTCYKKQIATIPIQLNNGQETEQPITTFLENVNKQQNNRYKDYVEIAKKIENGVKSKDNNKSYFENIKLEKNEIDRINYCNFFYKEKIEKLKNEISGKINNFLGKNQMSQKKLHWDKDKTQGCKNGKLLNERKWRAHGDYINQINKHYDDLLKDKKAERLTDLQPEKRFFLLEKLSKKVDELGKTFKKTQSKPFFACCSKNDYKEIKTNEENAGLSTTNHGYHKQGIY